MEDGERYPLTSRDLAELRASFDAFAERKPASGPNQEEEVGISAKSLREMAARALGVHMPLEKCREAISLWCDGDLMDFEAFLVFYSGKIKSASTAEELRAVFHMLKDDPRNNSVPASTVARAICELSGLSEKRVTRLFRDAFPGRDVKELLASGSLTFDEFATFMR